MSLLVTESRSYHNFHAPLSKWGTGDTSYSFFYLLIHHLLQCVIQIVPQSRRNTLNINYINIFNLLSVDDVRIAN